MDQPFSLGAIARASGADLLATRALTPAQIKVLRSIADCRTEAMGGHRDRCDRCDYEHTFWSSCRDRHCPGCGAEARESWLEKRREEVLDVPYFHVVFTIPECLNALVLHTPEILYAILLRAAGQALLDVAASKLHAHIGILTVLHTWGQHLVFHPTFIVSFPAAASRSTAAAGCASPQARSFSRSRFCPAVFALS